MSCVMSKKLIPWRVRQRRQGIKGDQGIKGGGLTPKLKDNKKVSKFFSRLNIIFYLSLNVGHAGVHYKCSNRAMCTVTYVHVHVSSAAVRTASYQESYLTARYSKSPSPSNYYSW